MLRKMIVSPLEWLRAQSGARSEPATANAAGKTFVREEVRVMSKRIVLAVGLLVACVLLGGLMGWSQRPVEWQLGLLQTARVAVDAATYGHAYESQAERVLLYFIYGGMLGSVVAVLLVIILRRRPRERALIAP